MPRRPWVAIPRKLQFRKCKPTFPLNGYKHECCKHVLKHTFWADVHPIEWHNTGRVYFTYAWNA